MRKTVEITEVLSILAPYVTEIRFSDNNGIELYAKNTELGVLREPPGGYRKNVNKMLDRMRKALCALHTREQANLEYLDKLLTRYHVADTSDEKLQWLSVVGTVRIIPNAYDYTVHCSSSFYTESVSCSDSTLALALSAAALGVLSRLTDAKSAIEAKVIQLSKEIQHLDVEAPE